MLASPQLALRASSSRCCDGPFVRVGEHEVFLFRQLFELVLLGSTRGDRRQRVAFLRAARSPIPRWRQLRRFRRTRAWRSRRPLRDPGWSARADVDNRLISRSRRLRVVSRRHQSEEPATVAWITLSASAAGCSASLAFSSGVSSSFSVSASTVAPTLSRIVFSRDTRSSASR